MTTIYRGLNVNRLLNDVDDKGAALLSLGLDSRDLDSIRGISDSVSATELRLLAGLQSDQRKEFVSLAGSAKEVGSRLESLRDFRNPYEFNLNIDNTLAAKAIKFSFIDFNGPTIRQADISTSRISSWSSVTGGEIFYGGDVEVIGDKISLSSFRIINEPIEKTFRAEVATHQISLRFESSTGVTTDRVAFAMKGIPLTFKAFFKDANLSHAVNSVGLTDQFTTGTGRIPATWRVINDDNGASYNSGDGSPNSGGVALGDGSVASPATYTFRDPGSKARTVEFFYPSDRILRLDLPGINLGEWPSVSLDNIETINISSNDFFEMPRFGTGTGLYGTDTTNVALAPALKDLYLTGNNMGRAIDEDGLQVTANVQLQYLPPTMKYLQMNGVFSDNETIDLRHLTVLDRLDMNTYYTRDAARAMTGSIDTFTKTVNFPNATTGTTITINNHGYSDNDYALYSDGGGVAPGGLTTGTYYYIINTAANTFQLAATPGGSAISLTAGSGTGTLSYEAKNGSTPRVDENIQTYIVERQPYSKLADGVCDSTRLDYLNIQLCSVNGRETPRHAANGLPKAVNDPNTAPVERALTIASPTIDYFYSYSNSHNIVDFSNNQSLYYYWHRYSRSLPVYDDAASLATGLPEAGNGRRLGVKISGCTNLFYHNFYASDVQDDLQTSFANLPNLYRFDIRYTRMYGRLSSQSFAGCPRMTVFLVAGSYHGNAAALGEVPASTDNEARDDFFSANTGNADQGQVFYGTNLGYLYAYGNGNIGGDFPDLSQNTNLRVIYIYNTSMGARYDTPAVPGGWDSDAGADLPSFAANFRLYYLRVNSCRFNGPVPAFQSNGLYYLFLYNNQFSSLPAFSGTNIRYVYLQNNVITGVIPTYQNCPRLLRLYLNNNQLSGYTAGSLASNTIVQIVDFSGNRLSASDGVNIINDLTANYIANPRGGVTVNLINQNGLTESNINADPNAAANLTTLRSAGWSIQLTP